MALRVATLSELDQDDVDQLFAEVTELLQEAHPAVELTRGAFHDLVAYLGSVIGGALPQANVDKVLRSRSLLEIRDDPELAEPELVDHVLANHRVARDPGAKSTGEITVIVNEDATVVIPANLIFEASGVEFAADSAFTGRPTGSAVVSITDRVLQALGDETFAFTITATAVEEGPSGNVRRGTKLVPAAIPERFVTAFATRDFSDGFAAETNSELLDKLVAGDAAKTIGGRVNYSALIKADEAFSRTLDYSIIGMHNTEMARDQHGLFPISGGGRVDIYARTSALPESKIVTVTATFIELTGDGFSRWQFSLDRDTHPGFYEVERIVKPNSGADDPGYELSQDLRGTNISDDDPVPDMINTTESAYTRYQTAVIRFVDTDSSVVGLVAGTTAVYEVTLLAMPQIKELQDYLLDHERYSLANDVLVKAPVPCFLSLSMEVRKDVGEDDPDTGAIANELADRVNNLGFTGQLHASILSDVVHNHLFGRQAVSQIDMHGRIRRPDGTITYVRGNSILALPDDPTRLVTGRTTAFILDPQDIDISVVAAGYTHS